MSPGQSDREKLLAMRREAEALACSGDPLLAGAVAQIVGTIDALLRIAAPPERLRGDSDEEHR
jgi:hypothetical protein